MGTNGCSDIGNASITNLYDITVKNLVELMAIWEMLIYEIEESFAYICCNPFAVRWVKPNDPRQLLACTCSNACGCFFLMRGELA